MNKRKLAWLWTVIGYGAWMGAVGLGRAAEHPTEHPVEHSQAQVQPAENEEAPNPKMVKKEFSAAVKDYVAEQSRANQGAFVVHDPLLNKDWRLKLDHIHEQKIVRLAPDKFFACADFGDLSEAHAKVDLDFYETKTATGWQVDDVLIHKVNGKPRYTYNEKNERVPVEPSASE